MLRDFKRLPTSHSICQETSFRLENNLLWDCLRASGDLDNHGTATLPQGLPPSWPPVLGEACIRDSAPAVHLWVAVSASRMFLESYIQWCPFLSCIIKVTHKLWALIGQEINYANIAASKLLCLLYILSLPPKEMSDMMKQIWKDILRVPQNVFKPLERMSF